MAIAASSRAVIFGPLTSYASGVGVVQSNLVTVVTPWGIKVRAHKLIASRFLAACVDAEKLPWNPQRIDSFAPRTIRGSTAVSMHAYGLAWDFFATPPNVVPPGGVWTPDNPVPRSFAAVFEAYGFRWGGDFKRTDLPHIEWAEGRPEALVIRPPEPPPPAPDVEENAMNLAIAITPNGDRYRFGRGGDGRLWMSFNNGTWSAFNGPPGSGMPACTLAPNSGPSAYVDPLTQKVVVLVIGTDNKAYEMRQTGGANAWTGPHGMGGSFA